MPSLMTTRDVDRRNALKVLASAASALMAGCSQPDEQIIPYVNMPEALVPGEPMRYATTLELAGYGRGFIATSVDGHPIKIEGNPRHPYSLGATDVFAEAEVIGLFDPERSKAVQNRGRRASWQEFASEWKRAVSAQPAATIALVTGRVVSATTRAQIEALRRRYPGMRWYRYESVNDDMARAGTRLAFGQVMETMPRWDNADVVLLLDANPLGHGPGQLRIARQFSARRAKLENRQRVFCAESAWSLSGAAADVRCALPPADIREVGRFVANALGANLGEPRLSDGGRSFANEAIAALRQAPARALVLAGETLGAEVHALVHWINQQLHAPVDLLPSQDPVELDHAASVRALIDDLREGRVAAAVFADANPVYDAPDSFGLPEMIAQLPFSVQLGRHRDETGLRCQWHLPMSHPLESWGDARALNGVASLIQPLIKPLYDTRTIDETLAFLAGQDESRAYALTRATWAGHADGEFEAWWRQALNDGVIAGTDVQPIALTAARPELPFEDRGGPYHVVLTPDPSLWDGSVANNAWLQECPKPFTRQVWGNAAQLAPADAAQLGVTDQDVIEIAIGGLAATLPVVVTAGQAQGVIVTTIGAGRWAAGKIGNGVGARLCGLGDRPFVRVLTGAAVRQSADNVPFRSPQLHTHLTGKTEDLFQTTTVSALAHGRSLSSPEPSHPSLLPIPQRGDHAWAMVVDTDVCIGCNACVVACQAENNVPIVGPDEISQGRDMHWLRVDGYASSHDDAVRNGFQPVPCMHCELAPCEPVCPVEASVHDHEGLNVQVYNRCIGTRFCQANCPYKVRRFNWFAYAGEQAYAGQSAALKAQHNPDVSARNRGVMEKCNYCLQRISRARRQAERDDRPLHDGDVVTACQAACPTRAIHFGDLNQVNGEIPQLRQAPQHYALLEELNTRPRTTYLKRVYNGGPTT